MICGRVCISLFVFLSVQKCKGIIVPHQTEPKPAYTSGIKTTSWKTTYQPVTVHNYSKVFVHNNPDAGAHYLITQTERTVKVYPVYNGHSYGSRTDDTSSESSTKNRTIYKRKIEYKTLEVYEKCPKGATGQFVYASSCNQFLNCWKGRGTPQNCAPGTLFNPKTLECDFPDKVQCLTGSTENTFSANLREQKSVSQASCPKEFVGLIPNYTDCSKFINCNNGQSFPMDCPPGTLFDANRNICDFPYKSLCFDGQSGQTVYENLSGQKGQTWQEVSHGVGGVYSGSQTVYHGGGASSHQGGWGVHSGGVYGGGIYQESQGNNEAYTGSQDKHNGQLSQSSSGSYGYQQNVNSNLNFGQDSTPCNSGDCTSGQTIGAYSHNVMGCNPSTQRCKNFTVLHSQTSCNPQIQNCNTQYVSGTIGTQQGEHITHNAGAGGVNFQGSTCNPQIERCLSVNTNRGLIYIPYSHNSQQSTTQQSGCNPLIQNCGTPTSGSSGTRVIGTSSQLPKCHPGSQNCVTGGSQSTGYHQQSFGTVPVYVPYVEPSQGTSSSSQDSGCGTGNQNNCGQHQYQGSGYGTASQSGGQSGQYYGSTNHISGKLGSFDGTVSSQNTDHVTGQNHGQSSSSYGTSGQYYGPTGYVSGKIDSFSQTANGQNVGGASGHSTTNCNSQNCRGNSRQGGYGTASHVSGKIGSFGQTASGQSSTNCDSNAQNCRTTPGQSSNSYNYETKSWGNCNPSLENCHNRQSSGNRQSYSQPKCPDGFQGLTKHPTDCKKFLNCANGQTFVQDCAPGTLFNPKSGNCDFPYNVDCQTSGTHSGSQGGASTWQDTNYDYNSRGTSATTRNHDLSHTTEMYGATTHSTYNTWNVEDHQAKPSTKPNRTPIRDTNRGESGVVSRPKNVQIDQDNERYNPGQTNNNPDYIDLFNPGENTLGFKSNTPRSVEKSWPPPFPSTDTDADYVFEYDDGEPVTIEPDNVFYAEQEKKTNCGKEDFYCSAKMCITKTMVCDGRKDCDNGNDERNCEEYIGRFTKFQNSQLEVFEKQKWINVSATTCALLCIQSTQFNCRSFNFRKNGHTCLLSDTNVGLSGALRSYSPTDYYELKTGTVDCSDRSKYFECSNKKCIVKTQLCDGYDDCGNRQDEKNCKATDFGYSIQLAGSQDKNKGRVEVTAFGQTGYICDDKFGIQEANVICKELGFHMGAVEFKGQSYFAKDLKENNTLYMMDDVECIGNETSLVNCNFAGWGVHNCRDMEIAGVVCKTYTEKCSKNMWKCATGNECIPIGFICDDVYDCDDDSDESVDLCEASTEIRLVNGTTNREGRLEIRHHGVWGTVCDDDFNEDAAKVVCKLLGYKGRSVVKKDAYFGSGAGPIWLDQVSCYGNESSLEKCTHWDWGNHNCDHTEDVGVICEESENEMPAERHSKQEHLFEPDPGLPRRCGYRKDSIFLEDDLVNQRVIGGSVAKKGDYPWQAAIRVKVKDKSAHWCGAVVLSSKWVITAAHCLQGYAKGAYVIVAGEYNTDEDEGTEQQKYIEEFFVHENFRKGHKMNNDIALIKLKGTGFILNDDIQPICLPDEDTDYTGNCTISGFGSVKSGTSSYSHNLMATWVPIHSDEICKMPHIYGDHLTSGMFCAGFLDGGFDACDGDSGGPLACLNNGVFTLYGITSWGQHCGYANKPGVYVKVSYYRKWIEDIINKNL